MPWAPLSPWKIVPGTGQSLALTSGTAASFANAVGQYTQAIAIRFAPASTPFLGTVTTSGSAATASKDYPIASTDPPQIIGIGGGQTVSVYQASGSSATAYLVELTH